MFDGRVVLCTGGTGSFGTAFIKRILELYKPKKIIAFSRDEEKQHRSRLEFNNPKIEWVIGDVRDRDRVFQIMRGVDLVFHAAALKQVPSCEFFPMEAVNTNIIGTNNVLDAAISARVRKVVCLSTDKAVYPINAMGMSKALMEKNAVAKSHIGNTVVCVTRYGNVMGSRGSVIPVWAKLATRNEPIGLTNSGMTRFLLSIQDAVDLVLYALEHGESGDIFIKKAPACTMETLAKAVIAVYNSKSEIKNIGIRHGEKVHESLIGQEEMMRTQDCGEYFKIMPDSRDLNYNQYFIEGQHLLGKKQYSSDNTTRLTQEQVEDIITAQDIHYE